MIERLIESINDAINKLNDELFEQDSIEVQEILNKRMFGLIQVFRFLQEGAFMMMLLGVMLTFVSPYFICLTIYGALSYVRLRHYFHRSKEYRKNQKTE